MFDIHVVELTKELYFTANIFYILIIMLFWKRNVTYFDDPMPSQKLMTFIIIIFLLFAFDGGDYYHYCRKVHEGDMEKNEEIYSYIVELVGRNYLLFRLIIWGGALLIFQKTARRFNLNVPRTTFILFAMFITIFDYARASLAMSIYFLGLSYICVPSKNKVFSYIYAVALIITSTYFHRSMAIAGIMTIMAFLPLNKKTIPLMLMFFAVSGFFLNSLLDTFLGAQMFSDDINSKIERTAGIDIEWEMSTFEWIRRYIEYSLFFGPLILLYYKFFYKPEQVISESFVKLYKVALGMVLLALATLITDLQSFVLFYRFLYMAMIPVVLLVSYSRQEMIISEKMFLTIMRVGVFCKLFGFTKKMIGGGFK